MAVLATRGYMFNYWTPLLQLYTVWVSGSNLVADHTQPDMDLAAGKIGKLSQAAAIFFQICSEDP
jgi:hypothetical protein